MDSNYKQRNASLIEEEIKTQVDSLHDFYIQLNKNLDALISISLMPIKEFREQRFEYTRRKEEIEKKTEAINTIIKSLKTSDIKSNDLKNKAEKIIKKIKSSLPEKTAEFNRLIKEIEKKQHHFSDEGSQRVSLQGDILNFRDYNDNKEMSDRRRVELEQLKQTSAQVASLSNEMKFHVEKQGETFNAIEDNVGNVFMNVNKGEGEIKKMTQVKQKQNRRMIYLGIACLALLAFVIYLITKMFR